MGNPYRETPEDMESTLERLRDAEHKVAALTTTNARLQEDLHQAEIRECALEAKLNQIVDGTVLGQTRSRVTQMERELSKQQDTITRIVAENSKLRDQVRERDATISRLHSEGDVISRDVVEETWFQKS